MRGARPVERTHRDLAVVETRGGGAQPGLSGFVDCVRLGRGRPSRVERGGSATAKTASYRAGRGDRHAASNLRRASGSNCAAPCTKSSIRVSFPRPSIPNVRRVLLERLLTRDRSAATWAEAVALSGWQPPPHKPRARFNAVTFTVRRAGYRTAGEVCEAAGISDTTFRRWEGVHIPCMPVVDGIKAIPESEFAAYVEVCRRAYLAAAKTRNKSRLIRATSQGAAS